MLSMSIVECERKYMYKCSEKIVHLDSSRLYQDCELYMYSPQMEGNEDCETYRCVVSCMSLYVM